MARVRQVPSKPGTYVYEMSVVGGTDSATGKQRTLSRRFKAPEGYSKKRADKAANDAAAVLEADFRAGKILTKAERKAQEAQAQQEAAAMPTFKAYAESWLKDISVTHAVGTVRSYTTVLERAGSVFNAYKLEDITPYMIRQYLSDLQREDNNEHTGGKLSWQTCARHYATLRCLFQAAEDSEIIERSPMAKVKRPRRPKDEPAKERDVFTAEQVAYIFECLSKEPLKWQALISFMLDSGCRRGEVAALRWEDIDLIKGKVTISRGAVWVSGKGVQVKSTKTGKTREFLIDSRTLAMLKKWKHEQALFCLSQGIPNSGYCFTGHTGEVINPETITNQFGILEKRYNIPGFHPHALRHTMVSIGITSGADVVSIAQRAGHANPSMTLNVYSHSNEEAQQRASEIIADAIYKQA